MYQIPFMAAAGSALFFRDRPQAYSYCSREGFRCGKWACPSCDQTRDVVLDPRKDATPTACPNCGSVDCFFQSEGEP